MFFCEKEPRLHGLLSCDHDSFIGEEPSYQCPEYLDRQQASTSYAYHGVQMRAQANIKQFGPALQEVSYQAAYVAGLDDAWNIGCDVIVYRNGNDKIGWHSDDSQGEQKIFCIVAESREEVRKLQIRPHRKHVTLQDGSQEVQIFPAAGDAYEMDGKGLVSSTSC